MVPNCIHECASWGKELGLVMALDCFRGTLEGAQEQSKDTKPALKEALEAIDLLRHRLNCIHIRET